MKDPSGRQMVLNALALLLAVRCRQKEAVKQLLARFYHTMDGKQSKTFMHKTIMLLEPKERDWLKALY